MAVCVGIGDTDVYGYFLADCSMSHSYGEFMRVVLGSFPEATYLGLFGGFKNANGGKL